MGNIIVEQITKKVVEESVKLSVADETLEIMENEAKIYMATYKQVYTAVEAFANAKNIDLQIIFSNFITGPYWR